MNKSESINPGNSDKGWIQKLADAAYIARRAGLSWIIPLIYVAVPAGNVGVYGWKYYENYQKHIAGTVETILKIPSPCSTDILDERSKDAKVTDPQYCNVKITQETTAGLTTEYRQPFYDNRNWDYTYGSETKVAQYPEGTVDYIKELKQGTIYDKKTYERVGEFLGFIPRVAPYSVLHQVPYSFSLNSPVGEKGTNFQKAQNFQLIPGVNVPTDDELKRVGQQVLEIIGGGDNQKMKIDITGVASPEGTTPESLMGADVDSYQKNQTLAYARAEYVKNKLVQLYPSLSEYIGQINGLVNTLNSEEVKKLEEIAKKLGISNESLESVDMLIKKMESGRIVLNQDDEAYITSLFTRSVKLSVGKEGVQSGGGDVWKGSLDYRLGILVVPISILFFMGLIGFPIMAFQRGRQRVHTDYYEFITDQPAMFKGRQKRLGLRAMTILDQDEKDFAMGSKGDYF